MRNYREYLSRGLDLPVLPVIRKDVETAHEWSDVYWIGRCLYEQSSGEDDALIIEAYEKAFALGLNIRKDREHFLTATRQLARLYFQYRQYEEAVNKLMILDSNEDQLPDWINLYYAAAQIQTDTIQYWAEVPELLFRRIDHIDEWDTESVTRRKYLFLEFLNRISGLAASHDVSKVDTAAILSKADELDLADTKECLDFQYALGLLTAPPEIPGDIDVSVYEKKIAELKKKIEELENRLAKYEKRIEKQANYPEHMDLSCVSADDSCWYDDSFSVDTFLPRRQRILILGGSAAKETHLRSKLKAAGFDFSKDQLEFQLDYEDVKDYSSRIRPWSGRYAGIIVGPCPHKAKDIAGYSSFIEQIKHEEGYPHVEEARDKSGTLKISNTSIVQAMTKMVVYLQSIA